MKTRKPKAGKPYPGLWKASAKQKAMCEGLTGRWGDIGNDAHSRWEAWHRGIPNAPEYPSAERIAEQNATNGAAWTEEEVEPAAAS